MRSATTSRAIGRFEVFEQDRKFIATQPCNGIGRTHRLFQTAADGDQQRIAGGVAQAVVDRLEAIQVEIQQGKAAIGIAALTVPGLAAGGRKTVPDWAVWSARRAGHRS